MVLLLSTAQGSDVNLDEEKKSVSIEELENLIRNAPRIPYVKKIRDETCIYYENEKVKCVPYNDELHKRLQDIASEVRAAFKGGGGRQTTVTSISDVGLWMSVIRGRRPLVEHLVESGLAWVQNLIIELGKDFLLLGLLVADIDFNNLDEFIHKFEKDPDALRRFVLEKVVALLVVAKTSTDIAKCRNDVYERDAYIAYLESQLENAYNDIRSLYDKYTMLVNRYRMVMDFLRMAVMLLPKDRLRAYIEFISTLVYEYGLSPGVSGS